MALSSTQPLTEISSTNLPGGKERPALRGPKCGSKYSAVKPLDWFAFRSFVDGQNIINLLYMFSDIEDRGPKLTWRKVKCHDDRYKGGRYN
jgi:hypothetical protein